jgi:hypothetical protein
MKDIITDSLRYWEPRRIAYNAVLALVLAGSAVHHPPPLAALGWQTALGLALMAVVANVLYCAAYAADLLLQMSDYRAPWRRHRWMLWTLGTAFAAGIYLLHD